LLYGLLETDGEVKLGFNGDLYPTAGASVVMTTSGDMVKYQSGARARLGIGSANQILQVKSSLPSWETVDLADTVLTTAGDVLFENATPELARLGAGTQYFNLQMGSALPAWQASPTSVLSGAQDVLYSSAANTLARLAAGTDGDLLTTHGTGSAPTWETPAAGGGGTTFFAFAQSNFAGTSSTFFSVLNSHGDWGYSESEFSIPCNTALTFIRFQINIRANNKASDQVTAFRDDSSDVAPITITASTTGTYDSGVTSVSIAAGSLICWVYHATVSGLMDMYASLGTVST